MAYSNVKLKSNVTSFFLDSFNGECQKNCSLHLKYEVHFGTILVIFVKAAEGL
jgi:hypothetical protein